MPDNNQKAYIPNESPNHIEEMIESGDEFAFTYRGKDYYLESRGDFGWVIVEPYSFIKSGGFPDKAPIAYLGNGLAKTPEEMKNLPFLDGKTIFQRFNELQFFDY